MIRGERRGSPMLPLCRRALELELHTELHSAEIVLVPLDQRCTADVRVVGMHVHVVVVEHVERLEADLDRLGRAEAESLVDAEADIPLPRPAEGVTRGDVGWIRCKVGVLCNLVAISPGRAD